MTRTNTSDNLYLLAREALPSFLAALSERGDLRVPHVVGDGARFLPYREDLPIDLETTPPAHPAKSILFPNPDPLFRYERSGDGALNLLPADANDRPLVAFGVRNCDVRAIAALDAVFLNRSRPDTAYRQRRERLRLIGFACPHPGTGCFCGRMGGGPFDPAGMDIQVIPLPDAWALRILTDRGNDLVAPLASLLTKDAGEAARRTEVIRQATPVPGSAPVDFPALREAIASRRDDPYWDTLAAVCLSCGICTFVCPVCSCFTVADEGNLRGGRRLRLWDACMLPTFTLEASGHNPRGTEVGRVKQRFFHKFYYSLANGEPPGCVGCGRCVLQCPVSIDIRDVITHFQPEEG